MPPWAYLALLPAALAALWVIAQCVTWPLPPSVLLPRWKERRPR